MVFIEDCPTRSQLCVCLVNLSHMDTAARDNKSNATLQQKLHVETVSVMMIAMFDLGDFIVLDWVVRPPTSPCL